MSQLSRHLLKASFIGTFAETMLLPIWATLTQRVGGSVLDAGIGYAIFSIATGIIVLLVGQTEWFAARTRHMVFWGFLLAGIGDMLYLVVRTPHQLFAVQAFVGISVGLMNPAWDALYSDDDDQSTTAGRWSFWTGGSSFVVGTSALAGAAIVTYLGFTWLFPLMAATDAIAVFYAYQVMDL